MAKSKITLALLACAVSRLSACALAPVESDPAAAQARYARMAEDCYRRGGTWNDNVKTCVGADPLR